MQNKEGRSDIMIKYRNVRKVNKTISEYELVNFYKNIDQVNCGYKEVMLQYGPGTIAGGILVLHPSAILSVTNDFKDSVRVDAELPPEIPSDWHSKFLILGGGDDFHILYFTELLNKFLIYDSVFNKIFVNPWGFEDPRYGFHGDSFFHGRNFELIFDSALNCKDIQIVRRGEKFICTQELVGLAIKKWFVPGDMMRGDMQSEGFFILYLSKLGGYLHVTNEKFHSVVDMVSISFDISENKSVEEFLLIFNFLDYEINRFE